MATDVTITNVWINDDFYNKSGGGSSFSQQIIDTGGGGASMTWNGNTANAVGTYGGITSIIAQDELTFDGGHLFVGPLITAHGSSAYSATLGSGVVTEFGQLEFSGHRTTDGSLGSITFHNEAATRADKMAAEFYAYRNGANYTANFRLDIANASSVMIPVYDAGYTQHEWWTNNISRMTLSQTALYSEAAADLGSATYRWGTIYGTNLNILTSARHVYMAGTGTRMVVADVNGDLSTQALDIVYPATSLNVVTSDGYTGDINSVASPGDSDVLQVEEATGVPGYDIQFTFADVGSGFNNLLLYSYYHGGANHSVHVELWDGGGWVEVYEFSDEGAFTVLNIPVLNGSNYIESNGDVLMRVYHDDSGIATHYIELDYVVAQATNSITGGGVTHHSNLTGLDHDDHPQYALLAGRGGETLVIDAINIVDGTTYISTDSAGNMIFGDGVLSNEYTLTELAAGGASYWTRTGTTLSPTTAGDDILLPVSTGRIAWGDDDTYLYEHQDDDLRVVVGSSTRMRFDLTSTYSYTTFEPSGDGVQSLGGAGYWNGVYANTHYVGSQTEYITSDSAGNMIFGDGVLSNEYTLTELAAGGGGGGYWSRSGTTLSPTTSGDYIKADRWYTFGTVSYIRANGHTIDIYNNSINTMSFQETWIYCKVDFRAWGTSVDIGISGTPFDNIYGNTYHIADNSADDIYITSDSAGNMVFADSTISAGEVTLSDLIGGGSGSNHTVARAALIWSNTSQTTIVNVPADAVIWQISVEINTAFNDSTTDYLDVGTTADTNHFTASPLSIGGIAFTDLTTNIAERQTGATNIVFTYTGGTGDADAGDGYIYVHYSAH